MTPDYNYVVQTSFPLHLFLIFLFIFFSLCWYHVTDLIKKLKLRLLGVSISFKIKFGYGKISVLKIGRPNSKTACINPWFI